MTVILTLMKTTALTKVQVECLKKIAAGDKYGHRIIRIPGHLATMGLLVRVYADGVEYAIGEDFKAHGGCGGFRLTDAGREALAAAQ